MFLPNQAPQSQAFVLMIWNQEIILQEKKNENNAKVGGSPL